MKRRLFFITLLMLFCTTMFGQQHLTMSNSDIVKYNLHMTVFADIKIGGETPDNISDIEIAAFHDGILRGVAKPVYKSMLGQYIAELLVYGNDYGDNITFKVFDPIEGKEYDTDYVIKFQEEDVGLSLYPVEMNFYSMHWSYINVNENYMAYPCIIKIDGVEQTNPNLELAAFINNELRGVARPKLEEAIDIYIANLMIDGENGETIRFKLYAPELGELETDYTAIYDIDYDNGLVTIDFRNEAVAQIGSNYYATLQEALKAITSGCTLDILTDITITENWDCRYTGAKITVPVTINGNGKTINFTGEINDGYNHLAAFRFEAPVTVENLTVDMSDAKAVFQNRFSAISTKANLTVNKSKFIGSTTYANSRAIIFGEGGHEGLEIVVNETEFINWKYGVVDNMNRGDVKSVTITGNTFDNADVVISAKETVTFTGNDMSSNSYVNISSYSVPNEVAVTAKENTNLAANTETECNQIAAPLAKIEAQDGFLTPVAEAGGKYYVTLQGAVNGVADSGTITLLSDIELAAQDAQELFKPTYNRESYCGVYIPDDKTVVLELNGKTVSYLDTKGDVDNVMVMNLGNLTINDNSAEKTGKITYKPVAGDSQYAKFYSTIFNCGTLTVNAGTIENTAEAETDVTNAVDNHSRLSHEYGNNSILIVNGGTLSGAYYYAIRQYTHYFEGVQNRVVINDGNINGGIYMQHGDSWYYANPESNRLNVDCYLEIKGGNINVNTTSDAFGKIKSRLNNPDNNAFGLNISGGIINVPVELLVQRGVYYENGVSGTTVPAETLGTRNAEWLAKNDGFVQGGTFSQIGGEEEHTTNLELFLKKGYKLEQNDNDTYGVVVDPDYGMVAKIGETRYETLSEAFAAVQEGQTIELLPVTISESTVILPATLKNVTVKGAEGAVLKDMTIMAADGNSINYEGITFDGVVFDNSRISVTGWRNNGVVVKDFTVTKCRFYDLHDETNVAPVHFNMAATEPVNGFTFTNNVIDGATGGSKSGVYAQVTGETVFTNNVINNVSFRPYVIQLTTDDGIDDKFTVTGNTFSGSAAGRAQGLGNNAEGTDEVELIVSNNIFKDITAAQQICYWNFNEATTTATLEKNYYDIDVVANPDRIYYNSAARNISELSEMGIFPIYEELNDDGTINEESLFDPVAYVDTFAYKTLAEAFAGQDGTIVLLKNIELTQGLTVAADKTFTLDLNGKVVSGVSNTAATSAVITNNGNLTVKTSVEGGKITSKANNPDQNSVPAYANNTITNCGVLTLLSGTIENSTEQGLACFPIDNNSTVRDAVLNINGGTVTGRGAIRQFANSNTNENEVNVTAGTVTGTSYAIWVQNPGSGDPKASLNIEGGELSKILMSPNANFEGSITGGKISEVAIWEPDATNPGRNPSGFITGGTFFDDVTEFCAFNYVCTPNGDGTYGIVYKPQEDNAFVIETLHELEAFRDAVNAGNDFADQTVVLSGNVNLAATRAINNWEPIGTQANPFKGTFDGGDNTISNLVVEGENYLGLFGKTNGATIKNVKINNVTINGVSYLGAIVGMGYTGTIDNCHVTGDVKIAGNYMVGGINGQGYATVNNSSVVANDNSFVKAIHDGNNNEGDNVGGIVGHCGETNTLTANTVKNITISGTRKVGGIVGIANQGTKVENCVVEDVTIETSATEAYANDNITTMSIGALIGQYQNNGSAGTVKDCMVKNVEFNNVNDVDVSVGPITGGSRGGTDGMLAPTGVTASGNNIYMSTITGSNNLYLMDAVAKIGTTEYYTLFDAVAAVQDGETITMLRNTAEEFAIDNTTANITLDMAGCTLNGNIQPSEAKLTIKNGTINNENASYSAIEINAGTLVLNDVKVTSKRHGVRIDGAVTATINGGEYRLSATSGTRHAVNVSGAANVTIKAGTFVGPAGTSMDSGSAVCVQAGAKVTIEGGDFSGGKSATLGVSGTMTVTGGTFDQDVTAYCAEGYFCELNTTTNKYEVFRGLAGEGTETEPYLIKNLSDLTFFRDHVNEGGIRYNATGVWVALGADIDMASVDWSVNICDDCNSTFDGIFDGKGYTLSNLNSTETAEKTDGYVCTGLFGAIYGNAVVKNFTIENVTINTGEFTGNNAAAVVGFAYSCTGSVENVNVTGNVNINAKNVTGTAAIVGYDFYGELTVKDCSVSANTGSVITGAAYVGGIVGYASSNSTLNENTVENININATSCAAGGIAGIMLATGSADRNTVKNVTLTAGHENWQNSVAAIIGCMTNGTITVSNSTIENVTPSAVVGSAHANQPTSPVAKVQARIGDKYYTTFVAALAAAQANETITLLDNVTLAETATIEKAITLDLKGMTVTGADGAIVFNVKAATTIKNGTIKGNKSGTSSGLIDIYANLNLNSVIVETSKINALRFKAGDCVATLEECNVTGAFKGYGGSVWEIKSGVYKASSTSINDQLNGTASISGGTFHYAIAEDECAPGYVVQNNGDGTWTVKYAPAAFVDANNNGTLDEGEAVYGNLDQIFAKHKEGDVYVVLTSNIVANAQVDTDADAHYHFTTNVAEGVTMDFLFADDWNYIQKMSLGQNITLNAKHLLAWTVFNVSGTINTDYLYTFGAATTIEATGLVNANTGDATIQVKDNATFTVKGRVNTAILNVWVNNAKLIVDGGIVNANWVDIWDGAPVVTLQNSAQLNVANIKASRGGEIVVTDATLTATGSIELGHNAESAGKLTESGNSTIYGEIKLTATGSTVASDGGLNVTTNIPDHKVVYENGEYKVVPCVYVAQVGDVKYESLQDAVNVGGEVTILQDFVLTETVTIAADKTVTLDLAGYTVSQTKEQTSGYQMILNDGTLTIKDSSNEKTGKLSYTDSGNGGEYISDVIYNRSVLVIDGGTIENLSSATVATNGYPHAVDTYSGIRNTSVTINGGTIYCAEYSAIRMFCVSATYTADLVINEGAIVKGAIDMQNGTLAAALGTLTINGGTFETTKNANNIRFANWNGGATEYGITASVKGGFFKGGITTQYVPATADFNKHFITGGTFATDVNEYCHENYDAILGADNLWRVEQVLFAQTTALHQGWNWYSSYVDLSTPDGLEKLQTALDGNGVQIKTQGNQFSFYQNNQWNSSAGFTSLYNEKMYMIQTTNDVNVELIGSVIDYANTVIVLNKGWNWISYPLDVNTEVNEALKNMSPSEGDIIKGYADNTTSVYYTSDDPATPSAWWPSITLNPGQGYMYKSKTNTSFRYAAGNGTSAKVDSRDNNYWVAAKSQYANNMTIIAMLSIDNEIVKGDYEIAAFANGECRGSARPIYNEYLDAYILLLTVYGDDVEELTFKYYDIDADTEYELSNVMNYSNDAIVGTIDNPYIFSMNILGIGENSIDNINIYPNPTTTDREINLQAICDKVEVFNALGVKIAEYQNVDTLDAFETAGIYVIRITNDNAVKHCRLVVK